MPEPDNDTPPEPGAEQAAEHIEERLQQSHLWIVAAIAAAAAKGTRRGNSQDPALWQATKAGDAANLTRRALNTTNPTGSLGRHIAAVIREGAQIGAAWADLQADTAGLPKAPPAATATPLLQQLAERTGADLAAVRLGLIRSIPPVYRDTLADAARRMAAGNITLHQAVVLSVDRMAKKGLPGMIDRAGRGWRPETYANMVLRTVYANASREARIVRLQERGHTLVIVSDSPEECSLCRPWEGKILSTAGPSVEAAATLEQARSAGLFHPRCTHTVNLWREGLTVPTPPKQNPEGYAQSQQQRALERNVRESKRRLAAAEAAGAPNVRAARSRLDGDRAALRTFLEDTGRLPRSGATWIPAP